MQDDQLDSLLSDLPRESARRDFTARVLARLDRPHRRIAGPALVMVATALAVVLVLSLPHTSPVSATRPDHAVEVAGATPQRVATPSAAMPAGVASPASSRAAQRAEAHRLLTELQNEGAALEHEIYQLRQEQGRQVIYLGGDDDLDMVVDLHRVPTVQRTANHQEDPR
jgi:hypothetical protein